MDLNEKIQARRNELKQEKAQKRQEESIEKQKVWVQSGGRKRLAKYTAKIILLPLYALVFVLVFVVLWLVVSGLWLVISG